MPGRKKLAIFQNWRTGIWKGFYLIFMNYQLLGKSGLRVSELCLGTMTFGEEWGWGSHKDESRAVFDAYVNAGGNILDTDDGYTKGTSEKLVGE